MIEFFQNSKQNNAEKEKDSEQPKLFVNNFNDINSITSSPVVSDKHSKFPIIKNFSYKERRKQDVTEKKARLRERIDETINPKSQSANKTFKHKVFMIV